MVVGGGSTCANSAFIRNFYWKLYDAFTVVMVTLVYPGQGFVSLAKLTQMTVIFCTSYSCTAGRKVRAVGMVMQAEVHTLFDI